MPKRVYAFSWDLISNIAEQKLGTKEEVDKIFFEAGKLAGKNFVEKFVGKQDTLYTYLSLLQKKLEEFKIGILRVEEVADGNAKLLLSVEEDLDCSGLPDLDMETCHYDEGFLKGILEFQTGEDYSVKEIDCWCLGGRTCRFEAKKTD